MRKLLFVLLATYSLFAESLPKTITTTVSRIDTNGKIHVATSVPKGVSGIIIHNYSNGLSAISHRAISQGDGLAFIKSYSLATEENIPRVKTAVKVNDKVIFGNFYNNALIIAPNAISYEKITKKFSKTWIHPDAYAIDFMGEGENAISLGSLKRFAEKNQVGLVILATKNRLLILDPISQSSLGEISFSSSSDKVLSPFFTRFKQEDTSSIFKNIEYKNYYQAIKDLK